MQADICHTLVNLQCSFSMMVAGNSSVACQFGNQRSISKVIFPFRLKTELNI